MRSLVPTICVGIGLGLVLSGCGGDSAVATRPIPNQGASFSWISGGGSGGAYELPANPPAWDDQHRDRSCPPGQGFGPTVIANFGEERIKPFMIQEHRPLAVMDDWQAIGYDERPLATTLVRMDGESHLLIPRVDANTLGITDPQPKTITGSPLDVQGGIPVGSYRQDEQWWCDPEGKRHLR